MRAVLLLLSFLIGVGAPLTTFAALDTMPLLQGNSVVLNKGPVFAVQQPPACELACSQSNAGNCKAGDVTGNPRGDVQCAASRIGVMEYTKLTSFGSSGSCIDREDNNQCASGSCTTYQGKPVFGVAHRTFPFGTQMEVCNLANDVCQIATVVERGPHSRIPGVTVDARAELASALLMGCNNTAQATYRVLSVPGVSQSAEPSGPASESLKKLLAAGHINGNLGNGDGNPDSYTAVNTPYGTGYLGNPTAKPYYAMQPTGSPYASASPVPMQSAGFSGLSQSQPTQQLPIQSQPQQYQTSGGSPFGSITQSSAGSSLLSALNPQPSPSSSASVPGAPAVASLYVQPRIASRTGSILLSWTSLNTKQASCTVSLDALQLATGEQGSKPVDAKTLPTGSLTFTLSCTGADGAKITKTDTITVQ